MKRFIPDWLLGCYHLLLAYTAAFWYRHPSRHLIVIGVTGTNGKSTTVELIGRILEEAGHKVGWTSTVSFKVANREWLNATKMTMLGRFALQKLLRQMVNAGCTHVVVETSSQGLIQHRHRGIAYDVAVFTNLTPEHLEAHGGFENYKRAKGMLFAHLSRSPRHKLLSQDTPTPPPPPRGGGKGGGRWLRVNVQKTIVVNRDDPHAAYFLSFAADQKIEYGKREAGALDFPFALPGEFNRLNVAAAIAATGALGVSREIAARALSKITGVPGRIERIDEGQPFTVIVDYAPEPVSLGKLYEVTRSVILSDSDPSVGGVEGSPPSQRKIIHVLGSCGGGRDLWRRPVMGKMAAEFADVVIVTNEDPYDDDPWEIINEVAQGVEAPPHPNPLPQVEREEFGSPRPPPAGEGGGEGGLGARKTIHKILDRREAIRKAVGLAQAGDVVLITGKGAEQAMCVGGGKKIPWDDRQVVREELKKIINQIS